MITADRSFGWSPDLYHHQGTGYPVAIVLHPERTPQCSISASMAASKVSKLVAVFASTQLMPSELTRCPPRSSAPFPTP